MAGLCAQSTHNRCAGTRSSVSGLERSRSPVRPAATLAGCEVTTSRETYGEKLQTGPQMRLAVSTLDDAVDVWRHLPGFHACGRGAPDQYPGAQCPCPEPRGPDRRRASGCDCAAAGVDTVGTCVSVEVDLAPWPKGLGS